MRKRFHFALASRAFLAFVLPSHLSLYRFILLRVASARFRFRIRCNSRYRAFLILARTVCFSL